MYRKNQECKMYKIDNNINTEPSNLYKKKK